MLIILDTFSGIPFSVSRISAPVEWISVLVFSCEYALRVWTANYLYPTVSPTRARIKYIFSFMAIIDLLSILPSYLPFIFPIHLRALRTIRLLRLIRILKINRYTSALSTVGSVIKKKASQLVSSLIVVILLMLVASILMYNAEHDAQPEIFQNAFSGMWWAMATITTVGYGDIYPITAMGKVLSAFIALLGIGLVAVPTGIISAGFVEQIGDAQENTESRYCRHCGEKMD